MEHERDASGLAPGAAAASAPDGVPGLAPVVGVLTASEARHQLVVETMLQGVVQHAADGSITGMNAAAVRILGKPRELFIGSDPVREERNTIREDGTIFPGVEHPSSIAQWSGQPVRGVVMGVFNRERNEYRWIRIDAVPLVHPGEAAPYEVYTVFEDITRQREVEQALRDAHTRKDQFIATLAHELRGPLAPIRNAIAVQRLKGYTDPEMTWSQDLIDRQVGHMSRLLDDLLDASRITSGKLEMRREPVPLADVIASAVETARPLLDAAGHALDVSLGAQPILVDADAVRLAQVFSNLLTNAAKYTEPGGRVEVVAVVDGADVVTRVRDTGIGIPVEHLSRVFDMFGQVPSVVDRSQGGLGIGLSLARALVHLHDGVITVHSDGVGRGTEFTVRLPRSGAPRATPSRGAPPVAAPPVVQRRVLVVDDSRDGCDSLAALLRVSGYDTATAYDGPEALAQVAAWAPEVVVLDIGLPGMNGYDVCRALRSRPTGQGLLLVALTGWGAAADQQLAAQAGFDAHFTKPVALEALLEVLGRGRA